jgi:hypothetical protein
VLAYRRGPLAVACNFRNRPVQLALRGSLLVGTDALVRVRGASLSLPPNSAAWLMQRP